MKKLLCYILFPILSFASFEDRICNCKMIVQDDIKDRCFLDTFLPPYTQYGQYSCEQREYCLMDFSQKNCQDLVNSYQTSQDFTDSDNKCDFELRYDYCRDQYNQQCQILNNKQQYCKDQVEKTVVPLILFFLGYNIWKEKGQIKNQIETQDEEKQNKQSPVQQQIAGCEICYQTKKVNITQCCKQKIICNDCEDKLDSICPFCRQNKKYLLQ